MNLAALIMIGDHSPFLEHLAISCCHYTQVGKEFLFECLFRQRKCVSLQEAGDQVRLENLCKEENRTSLQAPFRYFLNCLSIVSKWFQSLRRLRSARFKLNSPTHLPMIKYPVFFASDLQELQINQVLGRIQRIGNLARVKHLTNYPSSTGMIMHVQDCKSQVYQPLGDSFLASLVSWNPFKQLR